jgi:hypothetical protein
MNIKKIDNINVNVVNKLISKGEWPKLEEDDIDFRIEIEWGHTEKIISIPFDLFIDFIRDEDPELNHYLEASSIDSIDDIFTELSGFEWDFIYHIKEYIAKYYPSPEQVNDIHPTMGECDLDDDCMDEIM